MPTPAATPVHPYPLTARSSGVLLHPTSLPGPYGIGDLGPAAREWVDALALAGQRWWQVLPLGPTGYGDSPYQCFSAFAGNPLLVSPDDLVADGLLSRDDLAACRLPHGPIDYAAVSRNKAAMVAKAWKTFDKIGTVLVDEYDQFRTENAAWLEDYSLFLAIKQSGDGGSWLNWPKELRFRDPAALADGRHRVSPLDRVHAFGQFLFFRQWGKLRDYARSKNVLIIGDMPIFIAEDSSDVWANPDLFQLDADRRPRFVAGVPPDYFSATGQLWGNPLYDWDAHERTGFRWWVDRLRAAVAQVDLVRLDHFRGLEAYWEVPAEMPTAEKGRWAPGPGAKLLAALRDGLGGLPIIAEDLGVITPEVDALRLGFGLPGMRILQFAFGGAVEERFLPYAYVNPTVVYTGTHDNDTTRGWWDHTLTGAERLHARRFLNCDGSDVCWDMIRAAWASPALLAVAPAQDLLDLGTDARMNMPGRAGGNWQWRLPPDGLRPAVAHRLGELTALYGR